MLGVPEPLELDALDELLPPTITPPLELLLELELDVLLDVLEDELELFELLALELLLPEPLSVGGKPAKFSNI